MSTIVSWAVTGIAAGAIFALVAFTPGCAAFTKSAIPADFEKNAECVASQLVSGQTNVVAIETACIPGQLKSVEDLVTLLIAELGSKVQNPAAVMASMQAPETQARLASQRQ